MYNLSDFVCCIRQMNREFRASFHQPTKFPTHIDRQTLLYGTFASMCNWFQNKSPTHTYAMDWDTWHGNWAAPCYFNGAAPTGSPLWCHSLQRHLACEGLYWHQVVIALVNGLIPNRQHHPSQLWPVHNTYMCHRFISVKYIIRYGIIPTFMSCVNIVILKIY